MLPQAGLPNNNCQSYFMCLWQLYTKSDSLNIQPFWRPLSSDFVSFDYMYNHRLNPWKKKKKKKDVSIPLRNSQFIAIPGMETAMTKDRRTWNIFLHKKQLLFSSFTNAISAALSHSYTRYGPSSKYHQFTQWIYPNSKSSVSSHSFCCLLMRFHRPRRSFQQRPGDLGPLDDWACQSNC